MSDHFRPSAVNARPVVAGRPLPATTYEVLSSEQLPLSFDFAPLLEVGETLIDPQPVSVLIRVDTQQRLDFLPAAVRNGNIVVQQIQGLTAGMRYRLMVLGRVSANKTWAQQLWIACVG